MLRTFGYIVDVMNNITYPNMGFMTDRIAYQIYYIKW